MLNIILYSLLIPTYKVYIQRKNRTQANTQRAVRAQVSQKNKKNASSQS